MNKAKNPSYYMLTLSGQGDIEVKFVTQAVWDWIFLPFTNKTIPPEVVVELDDERGVGRWYVNITSGSYTNDRALNAPAKDRSFYDMKEAMNYIRKHNVDILETYEGYIY